MKNLIFIFLTFSINLVSFGQENGVLVHFNNVEDRISKTSAIEALINIDDFKKVASQTNNGTVRIQFVFYDPTIQGILETSNEQSNNTSQQYLTEWVGKYDILDKRILFFFVKSSSAYSFNSLFVTSNLTDDQLPTIVVEYIRDEIVKKETTIESAITKGVNGFKNAFDQQFKDRLVENAATLFDDSKYYKGYSCIDYDYYFFEQIVNSNPQSGGCNPLYFGTDYKIVVPHQPPVTYVNPDLQSVVMDHAAEKSLAYQSMNVATGSKQDVKMEPSQTSSLTYYDGTIFAPVTALNYKYDYFDFSQPATAYTGLNDSRIPSAMKSKLNSMYWNPYQFKEWRYNDLLNSPLTFEDAAKACSGTHRVKVVNGRIRARIDQVDERQGVSTYGSDRFNNAQPTWCNVFARELSRIVFGQDAFPPKNCKDLLNNEFKIKKEAYIELKDDDKTAETIWNLINKGYPVYFVSEGHIETGFPDKYAYTSFRYRYQDDSRYEVGKNQKESDSNNLNEVAGNDTNLVVGAGVAVGFKENWDENKWLQKTAMVYIYLGYLKNVYQ